MSKTAVSFAFNSPERLAPETATRILPDRRGPRVHAASRRADAHPAPDDDDRRADAAGPQRQLQQPVVRGVQRRRRARGRGERLRPALHLAAARQPARRDEPGDRRRRRRDRPVATTIPRSSRSGGPGCRSSWSTRPRSPSTARSRSTMSGGAHAAAEPPCRPRPPRRPGPRRRAADARRAETRMASSAGACAATARRSPASASRSRTITSLIGPANIDGGIAITDRAWEDGHRPTAILAMSDAMAIGAMRALRGLRLDVPGDVSVVGFDDIDLAPHVDPPLTTVHQPIRRKGEEAVQRASDRRRTTGSSQARAPTPGDAAHRPRLHRARAHARTGGGRRPTTEVDARRAITRSVRLARGRTALAAFRGDHRPVRPAESGRGPSPTMWVDRIPRIRIEEEATGRQ